MAIGWRRDYTRYKEYFLNTYSVYRKKESVKVFLELLLTLSAISILALFALRPTVLTITDLLKQIERKENLIVKMDTKIQNLSNAQAIYAQQAANIEILSSAIPTSAEPHRLTQQLVALFAQNGLGVTSLALEEAAVKGINTLSRTSDNLALLPEGASSLPFTVATSGDYNLLKAIISDLENTRRPSAINTIMISSSTSEEGTNLILSVEGQSIFMHEENGK